MRFFLVCIALLVGCEHGPSPGRVIDQHRLAVNCKIEAMVAVGARAAKLPAVTTEELTLGRGELTFKHGPAWNSGFIQLEDFRDLLNKDNDLVRLDPETFWNDALALARTGIDTYGRRPNDATWVRAQMKAVEDLRYLLIVRTESYVKPEVDPAKPGRWQGDILVFDVDQRELIGGLKFAVEAARGDLVEQARAQVGARLAQLAPGTEWPPRS